MPDSTTDSSGDSSSTTPDLVASTGVNDQSSPWNGLLYSALQSGLNVGTTALNNAIQQQTPVTANNGAPNAVPAAIVPSRVPFSLSGLNWTVWALVGVGVLVVAWLVLKKN